MILQKKDQIISELRALNESLISELRKTSNLDAIKVFESKLDSIIQ